MVTAAKADGLWPKGKGGNMCLMRKLDTVWQKNPTTWEEVCKFTELLLLGNSSCPEVQHTPPTFVSSMLHRIQGKWLWRYLAVWLSLFSLTRVAEHDNLTGIWFSPCFSEFRVFYWMKQQEWTKTSNRSSLLGYSLRRWSFPAGTARWGLCAQFAMLS